MFPSESNSETCNLKHRPPSKCCKFYALNRYCRYGIKCRYLHERYSAEWNSSEVNLASKGTQPKDQVLQEKEERLGLTAQHSLEYDQQEITGAIQSIATITGTSEKGNNGATPTESHECEKEESQKATGIKECTFFSKNGWCRYGNGCRYIHAHRPVRPRTKIQAVHGEKLFNNDFRWTNRDHRVCAFYLQGNKCKRKDNCRYLHPAFHHPVGETAQTNLSKGQNPKADDSSIIATGNVAQSTESSRPALKAAKYGKNRPKLRQKPVLEQESMSIEPVSAEHRSTIRTTGNVAGSTYRRNTSGARFKKPGTYEMRQPTCRPPILEKELLLSEISDEEIGKYRTVEINQLKKRFTKDCINELDNGNEFVVTVSPSDPDWPFDVKEMHLWINFPVIYPKECLVAEVRGKDNELFPDGLIRHLTNSVKNWLKERHETNITAGKVQLIFRPFLKWLDKNMEELFTHGLKMVKRNIEAEAAGIEFVPYEQLPGSQSNKEGNEDETLQNELQDQLIKETFEALSKVSVNDTLNNYNVSNPEGFSDKSTVPLILNDLKTPKSGTEIKLRNFQLGENTASIVCQKLHVTIQCSRCKEKHDIVTEPRRKNIIPCPKCHLSQQVTFRPSMLHPFSAVLGYLDLLDCQAVDLPLVDSIFAVDCLNCNKQMSVDGVHYGQTWTSWCHQCNLKLSIYIDSTKFQLLQPNNKTDDGPANLIKLEKKEKKVRDPAIQEGRPLPDNGTCKHFKKSFRWFRFPCCGKAYPCDLCHDEKELEHEMKRATRIICGFCAKEQIYATNKPCTLCASTMTKITKDHWEGGKGCRDKVKMSRDDRHKYSGFNKTTSRKVIELQEKKKKKVQTKAD